MKKLAKLLILLSVASGLMESVYATNGDNLIGVGPISRALGGTAIASPHDAISAVFSNPAALSQIDAPQFDFAGTYFSPTVKADVKSSMLTNWKDESQDAAYVVPAIGIAVPLNDKMNFGLAAYGVSGMGVDYRNEDPKHTNSKVSVMKFVPAFSYKHNAFSYGVGIDVDYQAADLGEGLSHNYALGLRLGAGYVYGNWKLGLTYATRQTVKHKRIYDFDGYGLSGNFDGSYEDLKIANPAQYGAGISYSGIDRWQFSAEIKYIDWDNAYGYKDFDWRSQTVYAIGVQNETTERLTLRAGWNYGKNPLRKHDNFNPVSTTSLQGMNMSRFGYEYFRIIGFPAIVENHLTVGLGYKFSPKFTLNLGYKRAFEKSMVEHSSDGYIKSTLSEDAVDLGLNFKF